MLIRNKTISNPIAVLQSNKEDEEEEHKIKIVKTCISKELLQENADSQEQFDTETIVVEALERLIHDLNTNHMQTKGQIEKKMKRMQRNHNVKIDNNEKMIKARTKD